MLNYWASVRTGGGNQVRGNVLLLVLSYALYAQWNPVATLVLLYVTLVTFCGALIVEKRKGDNTKSLVVIFALLAIFPLLVFKYYSFLANSISDFFSLTGVSMKLPGLNWAIPLGLSFFTFQAVGYLLDVYKHRIVAEKNWWDYMLFVSFFPQILSGPISKASELLPQIKGKRLLNEQQVIEGFKLLLWGMFMKTCMADRLGIYVDSVYDNYAYNSGSTCLLASFAYTMQIYGDFAGYSLMAVGVGKTLGFELVNNFCRPYFATSITEFWKRWHISLTRWLTTHIYINLGGNRCSKARQYMNIMVTFFVSGLWHGANWTFVLWGVIHGGLQIIEKVLGLDPKGKTSSKLFAIKGMTLVRIALTFLIVNFAWIFFRSPDICTAISIIERITVDNRLIITTGIGVSTIIFFLPLIMVIVKEVLDECAPDRFKLMDSKYTIVRWSSYFSLMMLILLFGVLDSSNFIYVSF